MNIAVVGEVLVDLVWPMGTNRIVPHPGGSPANVAVGLHRLGRQVTQLSCWGDDPPGELIDSYLAETGMSVRRLISTSRRSTIAHVYLDPSTGSATYDFLAIWDPTEIIVPEQTILLHTGSLAAVVEPGATPILKACRALRNRPGCAVSIDLNVRPAFLPTVTPTAHRSNDLPARSTSSKPVTKTSPGSTQSATPKTPREHYSHSGRNSSCSPVAPTARPR